MFSLPGLALNPRVLHSLERIANVRGVMFEKEHTEARAHALRAFITFPRICSALALLSTTQRTPSATAISHPGRRGKH